MNDPSAQGRLRNRLKRTRLAPTLRRALNAYRVIALYPARRVRNFFVNIVHYRLASAWLRGIRRHGWRYRATIGFTPDQPNQTSQIYRIMLMNRYRWVDAAVTRPDITLYWAYGATDTPPTTAWEPDVNARCRDITKRHVDAIHREVFGYGIELDPLTHHGEAFVKSDGNALHDGHIEQLPVAQPEPGMVYQRLIRNEVLNGAREDIRVPVSEGLLPFVYLVYRNLENTISGKLLDRSRMYDIDAILSHSEQTTIEQFSRVLGLQFGELDALRDTIDGRLYIVDANRAVGASILPPEERYWESLTLVADSFDKAFNPISDEA